MSRGSGLPEIAPFFLSVAASSAESIPGDEMALPHNSPVYQWLHDLRSCASVHLLVLVVPLTKVTVSVPESGVRTISQRPRNGFQAHVTQQTRLRDLVLHCQPAGTMLYSDHPQAAPSANAWFIVSVRK